MIATEVAVLAALPLRAPALLAALMATAAVLSAVFSNDIVCLTMAPIVADATVRRDLQPVPFLLGLACAANIGSAATLITRPPAPCSRSPAPSPATSSSWGASRTSS